MPSLPSWLTKLIPRSVPPIILVGIAGSSVAVFFHHAIHFVHHSVWTPLAAGPFQDFAIIGFAVEDLETVIKSVVLACAE
ncbi:MAG: hypothetical protein EBY48_04855, partial [Opitutae bacterium]|nr:hypothetical protein [Opitutae bacterium]